MQLMMSTDIALRTLIYLGQKRGPATIQEVADCCNTSKTHLMKVVMTLVAANFLASERGRNGGIKLAVEPGKIIIGDVVRLMESNVALVACMKEDKPRDVCPLQPRCRLTKALGNALDAFFNSLNKTSLADLLA